MLVTGAGGFIGRCVAARLREAGNARILSLERSSVALEALDRAYWRGLGADTIDVIFHLGAYTPKDAASADLIDPIVASNVNGTAALLASLPNTPRHLLFASSLDVYKRGGGRTIDETSEVGPATLYGASKFFGEELVRSYARATGCAYSILRLGHIYGPGEERYQRIIPSLIRAMLGGDEPQLSGDGTTERDYLYVNDAVSAIVAASAVPGRIDPLNIVRGESLSNSQHRQARRGAHRVRRRLLLLRTQRRFAAVRQRRDEEYARSSLVRSFRRRTGPRDRALSRDGVRHAVRRGRATIFLDLDGPVLECRDRHYACYVELCSRYGRKPRAPQGYWQLRRRRVSAVDLLMAGGLRADEAELRRSWIDLIEQPRYLKLDVPQPGAAAAVAAWKAAGHRLVVVTLRRDARAARAQLERLRLSALLERFVVCDPELGSTGKAAAARHEVGRTNPEDCAWIGDTEVDAEAAASLGCSRLYLVSCGIRSVPYLRSLRAGEVVRDLAALSDRLAS